MSDATPNPARPLEWVGSSKKDLMALPNEVIDVFGYSLQSGLDDEQTRNR